MFLTTGISVTLSVPFNNAEKKFVHPIPKITSPIIAIRIRVKIIPNYILTM